MPSRAAKSRITSRGTHDHMWARSRAGTECRNEVAKGGAEGEDGKRDGGEPYPRPRVREAGRGTRPAACVVEKRRAPHIRSAMPAEPIAQCTPPWPCITPRVSRASWHAVETHFYTFATWGS